jgi:hypothetical protein
MPTTVNATFDQFLKNVVNLDPDDTCTARSSRDWLWRQIDQLPDRVEDFPKLYTEVHMPYGSFARRTKIRELDDIDLMVGLSALGTTYSTTGSRIELSVPDGIALRKYCHDGGNLLNSKKVINGFIKALETVPQYSKAEIKRNGAAAVLNLTSYSWVFDIVPAFFTSPEYDGRTYYIIPDGNGHWMKTDPRIDQDRVTRVNTANDGAVLNALRVMKYWNRRPTMPTMPSYLAECIVLDYFERSSASHYVDIEVPPLLEHIAGAVLGSVSDPKGIESNINGLSYADRLAISARATSDGLKARRARSEESGGDHRSSIATWREIFGPAFPQYG